MPNKSQKSDKAAQFWAAHKKLNLMGRKLLDQHGLKRWRFVLTEDMSEPYFGPAQFENRFRRMAQCRHTEKTIYADLSLIDLPWRDQRDAILHEVAHALLGHRAAHGLWFRTAKRIGVRRKHLIDFRLNLARLEKERRNSRPGGKR